MRDDKANVERQVRQAWRAVLNLADDAADDNFFTLGGDSLAAVELVEHVESALRIEFPVRLLFVGSLGAIVRECCERYENSRRTCTAERRDVTVCDRILSWARHCPDHAAIIDRAESITYRDLAADVALLSRRLRAAGAGPDIVVALYLERSARLVTAATAVLASGAAYLMLDPGQPSERIRYLLEDSGATVVVSSRNIWRSDQDFGVSVLFLDAGCPGGDRNGQAIPRDTVAGDAKDPGPQSLAYVSYTSGSSGQPKGVLIEHGGLANLVDWYGHYYALTADDHLTQMTQPTFDAFALEAWPCLAHGATLHIASSDVLTAPRRLAAWLIDQGITVSFVPTPLAEELIGELTEALEADRAAEPEPHGASSPVSLRALLVGGDRLHRYPPTGLPFRLYNNYGPTECTVVATCGEVRPAESQTQPPPIGRPITNVAAYVLDSELRPVADGATGELVLAGAGVARGYLGRPGETGDRFIADPFSQVPNARMYRTGDVVRRDSDGVLSFLGRADGQLKIRGIRIEPGEVEAALLAHGSVRQAAVVAHRPSSVSPPVLVAYVVADLEDGEALRQWLAGRLPEYMVPAAVICIGALPVGAHHKIDRSALAKRRLPQGPSQPGTPPTAAETHDLAVVWGEVLGLESIDPSQSFFDLGGDSLRLMRLISRARRSGITLQPEDVYRYPVLRDLITALGDTGPRGAMR